MNRYSLARGLTQILPSNWNRLAKPWERWDDPADNITVAIRLYREAERYWPGCGFHPWGSC